MKGKEEDKSDYDHVYEALNYLYKQYEEREPERKIIRDKIIIAVCKLKDKNHKRRICLMDNYSLEIIKIVKDSLKLFPDSKSRANGGSFAQYILTAIKHMIAERGEQEAITADKEVRIESTRPGSDENHDKTVSLIDIDMAHMGASDVLPNSDLIRRESLREGLAIFEAEFGQREEGKNNSVAQKIFSKVLTLKLIEFADPRELLELSRQYTCLDADILNRCIAGGELPQMQDIGRELGLTKSAVSKAWGRGMKKIWGIILMSTLSYLDAKLFCNLVMTQLHKGSSIFKMGVFGVGQW